MFSKKRLLSGAESSYLHHYRSKILEVPCLTKKADIKPAYRPHEQIMGKKGDTIIK